MPAFGITGGIATGKSTFAKILIRDLRCEFFDADQCAHELLASDDAVSDSIRDAFGADVFNPQCRPDRVKLRERVFGDPIARGRLESILHPAIRARWVGRAETARQGENWVCFDLPLLYEVDAAKHFDRVIVVACSPATQRQRLRQARGLDEALAAKMIAAQFDLRVKITQADHIIWNDATTACLEGQAVLLANWLRQRYGQRNH